MLPSSTRLPEPLSKSFVFKPKSQRLWTLCLDFWTFESACRFESSAEDSKVQQKIRKFSRRFESSAEDSKVQQKIRKFSRRFESSAEDLEVRRMIFTLETWRYAPSRFSCRLAPNIHVSLSRMIA